MGCSVLIIDDHALFSTALRIALREHGMDAHQVTPSSPDAVRRRAAEVVPGLAVLDLDLGESAEGERLHGSDLVPMLREADWTVLVVSGSLDQAGTAAAIAAGAVGAVPKSSPFGTLLRTAVKAAAGQPVMSEAERQTWLARHHGYRAIERERTRRLGRLTRRELQVLELLADGQRAAAIAERFVVSVTTVRSQIRAILTKLGVNSQLEAVALTRQDRLGGRRGRVGPTAGGTPHK